MWRVPLNTRCASRLALGITLGCHGADPASTASSETRGSSGPSTSIDGSSSGTDGPSMLCTEGSPPVWCFERRDLEGGGKLIDLEGDGLDDAIGVKPNNAGPPWFVGFGNVGAASFSERWSLQASFDWVLFQTHAAQGDLPARLFAGSFNEVDTPLAVYHVTEKSAQLELELPLQHAWTFGEYVIVDTNHDDRDDVVVLADGAARMLVLLGTQDGGFAVQPELQLDDAIFGASGATVGDVDGDGHVDLLTARAGPNGPTVYVGDGDGGFDDPVDVQAEGRWPAFVVDIDDDGRGDILTPDAYGFAVVYSEADRSFRVVEQGRGVGPSWNTESFRFTPVDLDGDGRIELVGFQDDVVSTDGTVKHAEARLHVWSDLGENGFATDRSLVFEDVCDDEYESFAPPSRPAELDGDGAPDLMFGWTTFCPAPFTYTSLGLLYRPE